MWVLIQRDAPGENLICGYFRIESLAHKTAEFCRDHGMNVVVTGSDATQLKLALTGGRVGEKDEMIQVTPSRMSIEERRERKQREKAMAARQFVLEGGRFHAV